MEDSKGPQEAFKHCSTEGIMWWAILLVAVLAVPSFGFIVAKVVPIKGIGELAVFVLACWFCTYLGMRLMSNPKFAAKIKHKE